MSAPTIGIPKILKFNIPVIDIFRNSHVEILSPFQLAVNLPEPAELDLDKIKGIGS